APRLAAPQGAGRLPAGGGDGAADREAEADGLERRVSQGHDGVTAGPPPCLTMSHVPASGTARGGATQAPSASDGAPLPRAGAGGSSPPPRALAWPPTLPATTACGSPGPAACWPRRRR